MANEESFTEVKHTVSLDGFCVPSFFFCLSIEIHNTYTKITASLQLTE